MMNSPTAKLPRSPKITEAMFEKVRALIQCNAPVELIIQVTGLSESSVRTIRKANTWADFEALKLEKVMRYRGDFLPPQRETQPAAGTDGELPRGAEQLSMLPPYTPWANEAARLAAARIGDALTEILGELRNLTAAVNALGTAEVQDDDF